MNNLPKAAHVGIGMYLEWKKQLLQTLEDEMVMGKIKQAFAMMPPELKEELKKRDPKGYETVKSALGD